MEVKGHIQDPESSRAEPVFSQCCINAAVSGGPTSWGSVLMLRGGGDIIYWTCTEHYGSFSFSFTTYLFSLQGQSPIIWQWEHRKMYRAIMYFWGISLTGFFKLRVDSREGWKRRSWGSNAWTSADCEINRWMEGETNVYGGLQRFTWSILWEIYWFSMLGEKGNLFMARWTCFMVTIMLCKLQCLWIFKQVCSHFYAYKPHPLL